MLYKDFFIKNKRKLNKYSIIFIFLLVAFFAFYVLSFASGELYISLIVGIAETVIAVFYYYALIFGHKKLDKLCRDISEGIFQEDTYIFDSLDGETEHDGVLLTRVNARYTDNDENYERTLYFIKGFEAPLQKGQKIKVKTHRNIIIEIEGVN